jgi:hypothetical protein
MFLFFAIAMGLFAFYRIYLSLRPLGERGAFSAEDWAQLEDESTALLTRRDRLIEELRDIEFEAALNKVDGKDLDFLRRRYENEAVHLMGALETKVGEFEERIESDIAGALKTRRSSKKKGEVSSTEEDTP